MPLRHTTFVLHPSALLPCWVDRHELSDQAWRLYEGLMFGEATVVASLDIVHQVIETVSRRNNPLSPATVLNIQRLDQEAMAIADAMYSLFEICPVEWFDERRLFLPSLRLSLSFGLSRGDAAHILIANAREIALRVCDDT